VTRLCYAFVVLTLFLLAGCTPPPIHAERAVERGNAAYLQGDLVSAESHYREALGYEPLPPEAVQARNSVVYNNLGNAFYRQALWQDAQNTYEQALTTADRQQQAIHHYNLGNVFMQRVRMEAQSLQQLNQPQAAPDDVSTEQLAQWSEAAIANYQDALRRNPDDEDTKYNLELALQQNAQQNQQQNQQEEQQDDQQEQEEQDENEGDNEGENEDEQQEQDEQENDQDDEGDQDEGQPEPPEPGDDQEQPAAPPPLTQAQALQLLEAAAQQSDTLQEYLQRTMAPLPPPEQDW
jgi:hypothetical protein